MCAELVEPAYAAVARVVRRGHAWVAACLLERQVSGFVGFVLTTLLIAFVKGKVEGGSVMKSVPTAPISAPATPAPAAPAGPAETQPGGGSGAPTTPPQTQ